MAQSGRMRQTQRRQRFAPALLVLAIGMFLVSCGEDDPSASPTANSSRPSGTTTAAAGCADVAALKSSVQTLTDIEPLQDGLNALEASITDTRAALDTAVASVTGELQPVVEEVETQFAAVQTAVDGVTTDNLKENAPAVATALRGLETALTSLAAAVTKECPEE